jgi:hypothetical protein
MTEGQKVTPCRHLTSLCKILGPNTATTTKTVTNESWKVFCINEYRKLKSLMCQGTPALKR